MLTGKSEKRGHWGQVQGISLGRGAATHCSPDYKSWGPLEFRIYVPGGKKSEKKMGKGMIQTAPQRRNMCVGSFVLSFYLSLAGRNFRGVLRGEFQQYSHQFSRCVLSGLGVP